MISEKTGPSRTQASPPLAPPRPAAGGRPHSFHIASLDGIRALAFLIVFLEHASDSKWVPGYFGLTIFFFLSGYLITTLLRMEYDRAGGISFRDFYARRALRILPPFYLVLGVASLLTLAGLLGNTLRLPAVLAQVFHLSNYYIVTAGWWYGRAPGTWVYWSLAVEEHFYLAFPLVYLWMRRRGMSGRQQALFLLGLCAAVLAWRCLLVFGLHAPKDRIYVATDTRVDSILFGCVLAVFANPAFEDVRFSERRLKLFWTPLAIACLLLSFAVRSFAFEQTVRYTLQGLALFPLFVLAIRFPAWGPCRLLNLGWVRTVGVLSYSLYLMHTTVLFGLGEHTHWPAPLRGLVALGLCLLLAAAIHRWVEKPCARLRRHLSRTGTPARGEVL